LIVALNSLAMAFAVSDAVNEATAAVKGTFMVGVKFNPVAVRVGELVGGGAVATVAVVVAALLNPVARLTTVIVTG
jgi:hypothetical protein